MLAAILAVADLAFAGVDAGPHLDADGPLRVTEGGGLDGTSRPIEDSEEAVAGGFQLEAVMARQLAPDDRMVASEALPIQPRGACHVT